MGRSARAKRHALAVPGCEGDTTASEVASEGLHACRAHEHASGTDDERSPSAARSEYTHWHAHARLHARGSDYRANRPAKSERGNHMVRGSWGHTRTHRVNIWKATVLILALVVTCTHAWVAPTACATSANMLANPMPSATTFQQRARALSDGLVVPTGEDSTAGSAAARPASGSSDLAIAREGPLSERRVMCMLKCMCLCVRFGSLFVCACGLCMCMVCLYLRSLFYVCMYVWSICMHARMYNMDVYIYTHAQMKKMFGSVITSI